MIQQGILILFNILNAFFDAYRIKLSKTIKHGINFLAYGICVGVVIWVFHMGQVHGIVFAISAFFNRQITFDIPLNWRRGLKWDYVSLDRPPKALMDKIEVSIFGYNGRLPILIYSTLWIISIVTFYIV